MPAKYCGMYLCWNICYHGIMARLLAKMLLTGSLFLSIKINNTARVKHDRLSGPWLLILHPYPFSPFVLANL